MTKLPIFPPFLCTLLIILGHYHIYTSIYMHPLSLDIYNKPKTQHNALDPICMETKPAELKSIYAKLILHSLLYLYLEHTTFVSIHISVPIFPIVLILSSTDLRTALDLDQLDRFSCFETHYTPSSCLQS